MMWEVIHERSFRSGAELGISQEEMAGRTYVDGSWKEQLQRFYTCVVSDLYLCRTTCFSGGNTKCL